MTRDRFYRALGERIRDARRRAGLSQLQLAIEVGYESGVAVHYWETGRHGVTAYTLRRLEQALGTELYR